MMHGHEKSRSAIVAVKPTNKAERSAAESVDVPRARPQIVPPLWPSSRRNGHRAVRSAMAFEHPWSMCRGNGHL
jgi:hypothetical protein